MCTGRCSKPSIHVGGWVTVGNFKIKVGNTGEKLKQGLKDLEKGESRWFGLHWSEMTAASHGRLHAHCWVVVRITEKVRSRTAVLQVTKMKFRE